ncbi:MAG: hypothetical protein KAS17_08980 [Victivallaceae bacterium]|nr:hypothetical protein [Victivallaceae bacterium]
MANHTFYSMRTGLNPNKDGFLLDDLKILFKRVYENLETTGYFDENFGFWCVDADYIHGKIIDVELEIFMKIRKKDLWPISEFIKHYNEDDLFDIIEFLYMYVSKPIDGNYHNWNDCGMHWETFNKVEGQKEFKEKINGIFEMYTGEYELSKNGEILSKPDIGFEKIFEADIVSTNKDITERVDSAVRHFRRHGATLDDRRQAVRDLADIFEYLKPELNGILTKQDEKDLFNLANQFGIRHHNDKQKTNYDKALWLSWMFYHYLSTIHLVLRKIEKKQKKQNPVKN